MAMDRCDEPLFLADIARMRPKNLFHVVFDNEVYEASGSKKTATASGTNLVEIARAAGIEKARWANSAEEFAQSVSEALKAQGPSFIGVKITTDRTEVPPYPMDEVENKYRFVRYVEKTEKIEIFKSGLPASYV
jgi:thiamine pyrophosphate-dependent acetolactate synthase large subunit-like protein